PYTTLFRSHAIEIVSLNGCGKNFAICVAGHADEPREFLLASFQQALECTIRGFDFFEIVGLAEAVDVYEVQVIGLQASEAAFEAPEEGVARAIGNFCGQPDVVAARGHDLADTALALAVAISVSSVEVCDTEFDRMIQRSNGFFLVFVHEEATPAAKGENRNFRMSSAECALGQRGDSGMGFHHVGEKRNANSSGRKANAFQEFSAG